MVIVIDHNHHDSGKSRANLKVLRETNIGKNQTNASEKKKEMKKRLYGRHPVGPTNLTTTKTKTTTMTMNGKDQIVEQKLSRLSAAGKLRLVM